MDGVSKLNPKQHITTWPDIGEWGYLKKLKLDTVVQHRGTRDMVFKLVNKRADTFARINDIIRDTMYSYST